MGVVTPLNNPGGPEGDTVTVAEKLLNTEYCTVQNSFHVRQKGDVPGPPTRNPGPRHRSCRGHIPPQSAVS